MKLVIDNVSKKYKDKWAVQSFHAELTEGVYALLGPNGSGKTTLMRMLAGILRPTSGKVTLNGEEIIKMDEQYRDLLGYMPQEFGLYKNFTAERFLMYFASLKGLPKDVAKGRITELLQLVNLTEQRKKKTKTFSGGMKRRLGIAQALLNNPKILIVDEPTAGLDPNERVRFRNLLSEISSDRIVLLSTHIVSDIEYIAKDIMLMKEGKLVHQSDLTGLLALVDGKVWHATVPQEELTNIQATYKVGNMKFVENNIEVRIISDERPLETAIEVEATLEDVYLHFFNEEVGANV